MVDVLAGLLKDKLLVGEDLDQKIKAARTLEQTGLEWKSVPQKPPSRHANPVHTAKRTSSFFFNGCFHLTDFLSLSEQNMTQAAVDRCLYR